MLYDAQNQLILLFKIKCVLFAMRNWQIFSKVRVVIDHRALLTNGLIHPFICLCICLIILVLFILV